VRASLGAALVAALAFTPPIAGEPVKVRFAEGTIHGFRALRTKEGKLVATGENLQNVRGAAVTSRLVLRFLDGSSSEETTVFTQRDAFRLVSYHAVQKGPFFKTPMETTIDAKTGRVTIRAAEKDGEEKTWDETLQLPDDLANGLVGTLAKSLSWDTAKTTVSMVVATPKPRLVKLVITPLAKERMAIGRRRRTVLHYKAEIELGGLAGVVAPLIGKDPPDGHVWILGGDAPTYLMSESPLALGTPPLHMELAGPFWPARWAKPEPSRPAEPVH
jgi:hypothetical protein